MIWWMWMVAGLVLLGAELLTPGGFVMIFFGLSAMLVGGVTGAGLGGPLWMQVALFIALSIFSLLVFRKRLLEKFKPHPGVEHGMADVVGGIAFPIEEIAPGGIGKAEFRGTQWQVRNSGTTALAKASRCRIEKIDGLMLEVKPE